MCLGDFFLLSSNSPLCRSWQRLVTVGRWLEPAAWDPTPHVFFFFAIALLLMPRKKIVPSLQASRSRRVYWKLKSYAFVLLLEMCRSSPVEVLLEYLRQRDLGSVASNSFGSTNLNPPLKNVKNMQTSLMNVKDERKNNIDPQFLLHMT